jgi:calcium-dependent protein kinase
MYIVLCGYPPFCGRSNAEVLQKVSQGSYVFDKVDWMHVSEGAKNLIRMLLRTNPRHRYTAEQALNHDWILRTAPRAPQVSLKDGLVDKLRGFRSESKLKKAALHIIADQLSPAQIRSLRETFTALDQDNDGLLTLSELRDGLSKAGLRNVPNELRQIMASVSADCANSSGAINYTEFLAATLDRRTFLHEDMCWTAFSVFDLDGDGRISVEDLQKLLGSGENGEVVEAGSNSVAELLWDAGHDGDGDIDFEEFMAMMRGPGVTCEGQEIGPHIDRTIPSRPKAMPMSPVSNEKGIHCVPRPLVRRVRAQVVEL